MNRILAVIKKEFKEFFRDRYFVLTIIIEPIIMMFIFGNTFSGGIKNLKAIIVDEDKSEYSQKLVDSINKSEYFKTIDYTGDLPGAVKQLRDNKVRVVFYISGNFKELIKNAQKGDLKIYIDSSDYNIYNIINGAAGLVLKDGFQDIVQLIINDLEGERSEKQQKLHEIQDIVNSLNSKTSNTLNRVGDLKNAFDKTRKLIDETQTKINSTQSTITRAEDNIKDIKKDIDQTISSLNGISSSSDSISGEIINIQSLDPTLTPYLVGLAEKVQNTKIQIEYLKEEVKKSQSKINDLTIPSSDSVSSKNYNIDKLYRDLDSKEKEVTSVNQTANEIEDMYKDIQKRVDDVDIEFRTLKKEFISSPLTLYIGYIYGEISYFQYLVPGIMSLSLFFIGVMLTVLNIVNERNNKTLFRLSTTPLKKTELLGGKFFIFFMVGIFEAVYFVLLSVYVFHVQIVGDNIIFSMAKVLVVLLLLMGASIGLGLLISVMVKTMKQAVMVIPLIILPAILISNVFAPVEVMPKYMLYLAYLSPLYHSNTALKEIIIKGVSLNAVSNSLIVLSVFTVVSLGFGIILSKKRIK